MNLKGSAPESFGGVKGFFYRAWVEPSVDPMHRRIATEVPMESGRLLDVGCGAGNLDRLIAAARPSVTVVGLDSSEPMLAAARRKIAEDGTRNVEFRLGTVEESAFVAEFDFAVSVLSFHHWEEPLEGLAAVHRALAPGGRFWIYELDPDASAPAIRGDSQPVWGFRVPVSLRRMLARGHGFTAAEIDEVLRPVVEESPFGSLQTTRTGSTVRLEMSR